MKKVVIAICLIALIVFGTYLIIVTGSVDTGHIEVDPALLKQSRDLLKNTLNYKRNTYLDYIEGAEINYGDNVYQGTLVSSINHENLGYAGAQGKINIDESAVYEVNVEKEGYYHIVVDHYTKADVLGNLTLEVRINGQIPFDEAKFIDVPLRWRDESKKFELDTYGDESLPNQIRITEWTPLDLYNNTYITVEPLLFRLEKGKNTIEFINKSSSDLYLGNLTVKEPRRIPDYEEYLKSYNAGSPKALYPIDAILYTEKNSSFVRLAAHQSPTVEPFDAVYKKINIIDGAGWKSGGQEVSYEVNVEQDFMR
jgi:hypothetical protein